MRIHEARISQLAADMTQSLLADGAIETDAPAEVQLDIVAVLQQYVRDEQALTEKAKDLVARRGQPTTELAKVRRQLAEKQNLGIGDETIDYLLDQLVSLLLQSPNVEEVFVEDLELRRRLRVPLRKQADEEAAMEEKVKTQMKHVQESSGALWEVEYSRLRDEIKRRRGL